MVESYRIIENNVALKMDRKENEEKVDVNKIIRKIEIVNVYRVNSVKKKKQIVFNFVNFKGLDND